MSKNTGGQAFPCPGLITPNGDTILPEPGMTMRQYYAAKAMQGDLASQAECLGYFTNHCGDELLIERARLFWRIADAMIATENEQAATGAAQ
jgi:hypothetical protein